MADHGCANSRNPDRTVRYPCWQCTRGQLRAAAIEYYALHKYFKHADEEVI